MRRRLFLKISGAAYFLTVLTLLLLPSGVRAGTFYEDFSTNQKKDASTSAQWDTTNERLLLPVSTQTPLENEAYNTYLSGAQERGYRFQVLYDGRITALGRYRPTDYTGNSVVRLWSDDGIVISSAVVSDNSGWSFADIENIEVSSGTYYRVSVICESDHSVFDTSIPFEKDHIRISSAVRSSAGTGFPDTKTDYLTGVPDIKFVSEYLYPSTAISAGYDTASSTPGYLNFTSSYTLNGGTVNYYFSDSPDNIAFSSWTETPVGLSERYLRWMAVLNSTTSRLSPVVYNLEIGYNCPPEKPILSSPDEGRSVNTLKPLFEWENSFDLDGDTLTYNLEISTSPGGEPPYLSYGGITEGGAGYSTFTAMDNLYHSEWYWRAAAADAHSISGWSDPFRVWVDTAPPNSITDIYAVRGSENGEIDIQWTEPADSGKTGAVSGYTLKYATYTLSGSRWLSAAEVAPSPVPAQPDDERNYTITGLEDDSFYYIAAKTSDEAGNISQISNIVVSSTNFTPEIEINSPTGGEVIDSNVVIRWNYSDINLNDTHTLDITLSANGGLAYDIIIATGLPDNTTFYVWDTLSVANRGDYRLKVFIEDDLGLSSENTTANFTVSNENYTPEVNIIQPSGGETWWGEREIVWDYSDLNELDEVSFDIYISSNGGLSWVVETEDLYLGEGLNSGTTNYSWDTSAYPDEHRYLTKVTATDGLLTGEDICAGQFILYNQNEPPREFALISPDPGAVINVLTPSFNWEDSSDPDIPLGDSFSYRFYYSEYEDFSNETVIEGITVSSFTLQTNLKDDTVYFWKVSAIDESGFETFNTGSARNFYIEWSSQESEDGNMLLRAVENLPENSYINVRGSSDSETRFIESANLRASTDPRLRAVNSSGFVASLKNKVTNEVADASGLVSDITIKYSDINNDGYIDGWGVKEEYLRVFRYEEGRWELASYDQVVNDGRNSVTARGVKGLSLFSLQLYNNTDGLLGEVQNFPNPFRAGSEETEIVYVLNENSEVTLEIYTIAGDLVYTKTVNAGDENGGKGTQDGFTNRVKWDGRNGKGRAVADGIYILSVSAEGRSSGESSQKQRYIGVLK